MTTHHLAKTCNNDHNSSHKWKNAQKNDINPLFDFNTGHIVQNHTPT